MRHSSASIEFKLRWFLENSYLEEFLFSCWLFPNIDPDRIITIFSDVFFSLAQFVFIITGLIA
jgi:hypothetical protein